MTKRYPKARILLIILGILLVYPVFGNILLLSGGAERLISWKPEKLVMRWESAWTLIPGQFWVDGLELNSTTVRGNRFSLHVDSGSVSLSLLPTINRTVNIKRARGKGIEVFYAQNPKNKKLNLPAVLVDQTSTKTSSESDSDPKPNASASLKPAKPPWDIRLSDISAENIRKVAFNEIALEGSGTLDALKMRFVTRGGLMEVNELKVMMAVGKNSASQDTNRVLEISADLSIGTNVIRENRGKDMLNFWSGAIAAKGEFEELGKIYFLPGGQYNFGIAGTGQVDAKLLLEKGELIDGSHLLFQSDHFQTTFLDFTASGSGKIQGSVEAGTANPVHLEVLLDDFGLAHGIQSEAYLEGENLTASVSAPKLYLHHQALEDKTEFSFNIGAGVINDITHYNSYLPGQSGLKFLSGTGRLHGGLSLKGDNAAGNIMLSGKDVTLSARDRELRTDFVLSANLTEGDYERKTYRLKNTSLKLKDTQLVTSQRKTEANWWGELVVSSGKLIWDQPMQIDGRMHLAMRDIELLIAGFRDPAKKESPLDKMLNVKDIHGELIAETANDQILLDPIFVESKGLEVISRVTLSPGSVNGVLFAKLRGLSANVEIIDSKVKFRGLGGRQKVSQQVNLAALKE